ncbi:hypothetical protein [Profundibacter sp.]
MYSETTTQAPEGQCADLAFRLAVYEAGHALTARALGLKILSVRMLPRPPVLISDKAFANNDWESFAEMLEIRVIELFGGQIAEETACSCNTCGIGDIARVDELSRLIAGLDGDPDPESVMFRLEDVALEIFARPDYKDAIIPIATFLAEQVKEGNELIDGPDIEAELDKYVPRPAKEKWSKRLFSFGRK